MLYERLDHVQRGTIAEHFRSERLGRYYRVEIEIEIDWPAIYDPLKSALTRSKL